MEAAKQTLRKLISLTGYKGFTDQLKGGERLVLIYTDARGAEHSRDVSSVRSFNQVNSMEGEHIIGFFACAAARLNDV